MERAAVDKDAYRFFGPLYSHYDLIIIVDSTSKWVEHFPMNKISTEYTIKKLRETSARFGLLKYIVSDNGLLVQHFSSTYH